MAGGQINGASTQHQPAGGMGWLVLALLPLGIFVSLLVGLSKHPLPWNFSLDWVPALGISLDFYLDGLSVLMLTLISGIGTMIFVYAVGYLDHEPRRRQIFLILPLFMLAMMGAVSADNVIVLFLFWELTSLTSFLLVGFNHEQAEARASARQALLVTMAGGLALLGGLLLLAQMAGSLSISQIIHSAPGYMSDPRLESAIILILLGAFTKSAQFPFHFWLPNAMSAPTPVSAYLHSATMVKLGIYLMARFDPAFNSLLLWEVLLISVGTITAAWAAILALRERDLKRILARSTVSALGTLTLLIGLPSPSNGLAVVTFLFAHAIYKAPLFMVAGNIDHSTGTRVIDHLMGLRRVMPWTAAAAILAGLSMAGLPLAFGFLAKDFISTAKEQADLFIMLSYLFVMVNAVAAAVAGVAAIRVFWGPLEAPQGRVHEAPWTMLVPPLVIAFIGIEFEFFPAIAQPLLLSAAQSISPGIGDVTMSTSYAVDKILSASGITLAIGLILFLIWDRLHDALSRVHWLDRYGPEASYQFLLGGLSRLADWHTRMIQPGRLNSYIALVLSALLVIGGYAAWQSNLSLQIPLDFPVHGWAWAVAAMLMVAGAGAAMSLHKRIAILMASGLVGYGAAVLFLFAGAPDLAFTQFMVETALVVVAAAVLPQFAGKPVIESFSVSRLALSLLAGMGTLVLLVHLLNLPGHSGLADWYAANSLSEANGRNAVNVILVDFRALDTLGEIAVVAFSLLAALPLLQTLRHRQTATKHSSPVLHLAALPLYWLMLATALWILLRGHNEPGGGFIGGLVAVAASSLLAILRDPATARRFQPLTPLALALLGIALAILSGLIGGMAGPGFLRHLWAGSLSSVMLFDLGVLFAVWGALTGFIYRLLDDEDSQTASRQTANSNDHAAEMHT